MKKLLSILLIACVAGKSYGQVDTGVTNRLYIGELIRVVDTGLVTKSDTTASLFLVSDTFYKFKGANWCKGYTISSIQYSKSGYRILGFENLYYADDKFKLFPKNIIIWQAKQLR